MGPIEDGGYWRIEPRAFVVSYLPRPFLFYFLDRVSIAKVSRRGSNLAIFLPLPPGVLGLRACATMTGRLGILILKFVLVLEVKLRALLELSFPSFF